MLHNISWSVYLTYITIMTLLYYVILFCFYYKQNLPGIFKAKWKSNFPAASKRKVFTRVTGDDDRDQPELLDAIMQSFHDEVNAYLELAVQNPAPKDIMIKCLRVIARKYPSKALLDYKVSINESIKQLTKINCAIHFSEEEIRQIWMEN